VEERSGRTAASLATAALAATSVVARLIGGRMLVRLDMVRFTVALAAMQGASLAWLATSGSTWALFASIIAFGATVGNLLMLQPLLLAEAYGVKEYSRIYSLNQLFSTIGVAGGPFLLGILHDLFDYRFAFMLAAAANVIGFGALILAGPTKNAQRLWLDTGPKLAQSVTA
jgi:MFS family permease